VDRDNLTPIDRVWATEITTIPLRKGFPYLVAIMDRFSRKILKWKLSNSLDGQFHS
jgi:putative transposase